MVGLVVWRAVEELQDKDTDMNMYMDTDVKESSKKLQFDQEQASQGGFSLPQEQMMPTSFQKET